MIRRLFAGLAVASLALVAACGGDDGGGGGGGGGGSTTASPASDWQQAGGPLVVSQLPFLSDASVAIALAEGWFDEAGLTLQIEKSRSATELLPSLIANNLHVWFGGTNPGLFNAMNSGAEIKAVATGSLLAAGGCDHIALTMLPDTYEALDFDDPDSPRGMKIGGTHNALTSSRYLELLTASWGLTIDDVELIEVERAAQPAALAGRDVDAIVAYEPWNTTMRVNLGALSTFPAQDFLPNDVSSLLVFGDRLLNDRELGARFLAVYLRGEAQYKDGPTDRNVEILTETTGLEPDLLRQMCWATMDANARSYVDEVQSQQEYGVTAGAMDAVVPAEQVWDHTFYDRALELLAEWGIELS